jgi:glycosyltransferase involved in cell wall biosynthesis
MHTDILISVVITTCNRPIEVKRAFQSVIRQTYRNFEVIVIDDNSDADVYSEIQQFGHPFIYHKNSQNSGLAFSRNVGISKSTGGYIAFLDDDDYFAHTHLERKVELLKSFGYDKNIGLVLSFASILNSKGKIISSYRPRIEGNMYELTQQGRIQTVSSSMLIQASFLKSIAKFDVNLVSSVDHDIWMNLAIAYKTVITVDEPLVFTFAKVNRNTMMNDPNRRIRGINQFMEKWSPSLQTMLGDKFKDFYLDYIFKSYTGFAVTQLQKGNISLWFSTIRGIHSSLGFRRYFFIFKQSLIGVVKTWID